MWEKIFKILAILIIVIGAGILSTSALPAMGIINDSALIAISQQYMGIALLVLSFVFLILNIVVTRHVFYEYWLIIAASTVIGLSYLL